MAAKRRWSERMLLLVNLTVANCVAGLWIATFLQPRVLGAEVAAWRGIPEAVPELAPAEGASRLLVMPLQTPAAWLALLASIALLLWNFSWLVRRRDRAVPTNWIVSETAAGPVRVAREAIETALRQAGEALPEITRLRVQVQLVAGKRVTITSQFHCADGQSHLAASQRLREQMLTRFSQLVQLTDGTRAELEIEFQGFVGKLDKNAPAPPAADVSEEPEMFRGPQYPIDDELGADDLGDGGRNESGNGMSGRKKP